MQTFTQIAHPFFFSCTIWRCLLHPPEHPVFWRIRKKNRENRFAVLQLGISILVSAVISYSASLNLSHLDLYFPVLLLLVKTVLSSSIIITWIVAISMAITVEFQQATYDLICVAPSGALGANWSLATGVLHRNDLLGWVDLGQRLFSGLILLILLMTLVPIDLDDGRNHLVEFLQLFSDIVFLALFTYIDHIQTLVLGVLIAMLIPQHSRHVATVSFWSALMFVTLQIAVLTLFLFVSLFVPHNFSLNGWRLRTILPLFVLLYAVHECCIYILWKVLSSHLNAETDAS